MSIVVSNEYVAANLAEETCCAELVGFRGRLLGLFYPLQMSVAPKARRPWIMVPEPTAGLFLGTKVKTTVVDANGRLLGRFVPTEEVVIYEMPPEPTAEEWEQWKKPPTRYYTPEEVLAYLRSLG